MKSTHPLPPLAHPPLTRPTPSRRSIRAVPPFVPLLLLVAWLLIDAAICGTTSLPPPPTPPLQPSPRRHCACAFLPVPLPPPCSAPAGPPPGTPRPLKPTLAATAAAPVSRPAPAARRRPSPRSPSSTAPRARQPTGAAAPPRRPPPPPSSAVDRPPRESRRGQPRRPVVGRPCRLAAAGFSRPLRCAFVGGQRPGRRGRAHRSRRLTVSPGRWACLTPRLGLVPRGTTRRGCLAGPLPTRGSSPRPSPWRRRQSWIPSTRLAGWRRPLCRPRWCAPRRMIRAETGSSSFSWISAGGGAGSCGRGLWRSLDELSGCS